MTREEALLTLDVEPNEKEVNKKGMQNENI